MQTGNQDILFDKFNIISCIKKDSYSGIYIADHIYLGKKIFLKTLNQQSLVNPAVLQRFRREAKLLAQLDHPNIIKVYDFGTRDNWFYISFEYFKSRDLRAVLRDSKLTDQQKLDIFAGIASGLEAAHKINIIHRDIKPENILVDENGNVKIADFGLALVKDEPHATQQESIVGTPGYMSPEQIRGEVLTPSSDLFSLGIVGCELITGSNPFLGKDAGETLNNILSHDCPEEQCRHAHPDRDFCDVVLQMLHKKPRERPGSAEAILVRLNLATSVPHNKTTQIKARRQKRPRLVMVTIFILLAAGLVWVLVYSKRPAPLVELPAVRNQATLTDSTSVKTDAPAANIIPGKDSVNRVQGDLKNMDDLRETPVASAPGYLFIRCTPWAEVWIDSLHVDTTPLEDEISLTSGQHLLMLRHPDFPDYEQMIDISPGANQFISIGLDTLCGYLQCDLYPWGNVYIDDRFFGLTPLPGPLRLSPGNHSLFVTNELYGSVRESLEIVRKDTLKFRLNFEQLIADKE